MSDLEKRIAEMGVIRPGDTLVLRYDTRVQLSREYAEEVIAEVRRKLPDVEVLIIGADGMAVYKPLAKAGYGA